MTEDWSCLSQQDTDPYAQICKEAVEDDIKFLKHKLAVYLDKNKPQI